ncbi:leucine-rich repeat domain-containing protein [Winogradskyella thalassocola]|uniref:Por secretion system C-terminal sorting domain-containing protein n=1 Tax=Winogradskyella thalassocola TaxID=262004 RepID=A0A1G8CUS6_9FLAO|nr:leucine-rich repeat domain-containing protein [Winogradskyella thalassocola]SDH49287.1 Por secretion system C-terminal sorting domain-containing protein [Winogradskyella thalassocola]
MKKSLLILITLFTVVMGYSQTFTVGNFTYSVSSTVSNTIRVLDYDVSGGTVVDIPTSVTYNSTVYTINIIAASAFANKQLTSVTIPNTVNLIFASAFLNNQLTTVTIPNSVYSISNYAFANNQLTSIIIPESVSGFASQVFTNNPLTSVTSLALTPPTITTGANDTFNPDRSNIALHIPNGTMDIYVTNPNASADWSGFNPVTEALIVGDTFVEDFITYQVTSLTPDTVQAIDYDMAGGTVVDIPAFVPYSNTNFDVTRINNNAFNNKGLTSVTISDSVTSIANQAFVLNSISSLTIGENVINIDGLAFSNNNLTNVVIPNSVTNIGFRAFDANQITSVVIGSNVTNIESIAFRNNPLSNITSLAVVPPTIVTSATNPPNTDSFDYDRSNINLILTGNTTDEYVTDSGALWTGFKMVFEATSATTLKVTDYDSANGAAITIPASITVPNVTVFDVTEIGGSAFYDKGLTDVTIPEGITTIGTSAFEINNLTSVSIPDSVTAIGLTAFSTNSITNLSLGINVEEIGIGAFVGNNLTDVTIPSTVTNIGLLAFGNNPLLANVTSLAMVPPTITTGTNDTFIFDRGNTALHIPVGTTDIYVTNPNPGADWSGFNPVTEDAVLSTSNFELANDVKVVTTTDAIKIIASNNIKLENYTLYTIAGRKVAAGIEHKIPTSYLASGIYILKLDFNKGTVIKKVAVN